MIPLTKIVGPCENLGHIEGDIGILIVEWGLGLLHAGRKAPIGGRYGWYVEKIEKPYGVWGGW